MRVMSPPSTTYERKKPTRSRPAAGFASGTERKSGMQNTRVQTAQPIATIRRTSVGFSSKNGV
jgi:hypothetical protein